MCWKNTPSRESVSEWQFNQDCVFPFEPESQGSSTYRWLCQGEGDERLKFEALSTGIWLSEEEPFLNISDTGSLERLTMAMRLAGMHAVTDVTSVASVVRTGLSRLGQASAKNNRQSGRCQHGGREAKTGWSQKHTMPLV